ncbi:MAG: PTS sugar transporter subunit IIB [Coprobacillus sp.]
MIKILLCCGGGFSSSAIAVRMQKELETSGRQDQYSIDFFPLEIAGSKNGFEKMQEYDVMICCPHLKMVVQRMVESDFPFDKPIYLLPPKIYGNMILDEILADVEDVIEIYKQTHQNPVSFPGEDNLLRITRSVAYRHSK